MATLPLDGVSEQRGISEKKEASKSTKRGRARALVRFIAVLGTWALLAQDAAAQETWTTTGSMAVARRDHRATLLANGKVLVTGWFTTAAELYDPGNGMFSPTGSTIFIHGQGSTATRLLDGNVLLAGGSFPGTQAEIYNPATGTFSATGSLNVGRFFHTATLLADGNVLIAGGGPVAAGASAELYNPATGAFSLTGNLNTSRVGHTAAVLPDGRVLVAGGFSEVTLTCLDSAEVYNPATGTFAMTGNMASSRCSLWWSEAPVLASGNVLIAGGLIPDSAELFDPVSMAFSVTGSMTVPRAAPTVTLLPNGQVLVAGGSTAVGPVTTNSADLYDPTTETFTATATMAAARQQHTATLLLNGQVLVTGGFNPIDRELSSAELFSLTPVALTVGIDIKPGSDPNSINPKSKGVIPVAILTTDFFEASGVDPTTVRFGATGTEAAPIKVAPEDVDRDGDTDMILHFTTRDTGIVCGDSSALLMGETFSGQAIAGSDSIKTVGCK